jgi:hypothetical protein
METGRPRQASSSGSSFLLENAQTIGKLEHNSQVITIHVFQVMIHLHGSSTQFEVKFNHSMLLNVKNLTQKINTLIVMAIKR